jgi:two-component system, sensor histidine kinase and response regulator
MSSYSILVVDDQPENFEVIEALLERMNYTLHYASSGQVAIDCLNKFDPDLILLDFMMPEIDGLEVCRKIKAVQQWQAIPIIMVTSLSSTESLAQCLAVGADDFLSKPVNGVELRARVNSMLRIKKQHDRIESLSKLQRNSISSLKNSLNELNSDLAISFPRESDAPLHNVLDKIQLLQQDFHKMSLPKIREMLASANQSAIELDQFHQSFLFARQLSSSVPISDRQEICSAKISIEQIAIRQIDQSQPSPKLIFDIEDADLAVTPKHLQCIISELLDYILKTSQPQDPINIHGHVMNDEFHLYLNNQGINVSLTELSASTRFNPVSNSEHELTKGLNIAKKIVEIHEGLFLIGNSDLTKVIIYITLPLVGLMISPKPVKILMRESPENKMSDISGNMLPSQTVAPLVETLDNTDTSISDELREIWYESDFYHAPLERKI